MAGVGTEAITNYEQEDVSWEFTFSDPNVPTIAGFTFELDIRATTGSPLLLGPVIASIVDATHYLLEFNLDLDPGSYIVGVRRTDLGFKWQSVHAPLTVLASVNVA